MIEAPEVALNQLTGEFMKIAGTLLLLLFALGQETISPTDSIKNRRDSVRTEAVASIARDVEVLAFQTNSSTDANARIAISIWSDLNAICRGGSGDRPETESACCTRNKVDMLLNNLGYCYRTGDTWRKCGPRDKRARSVSLTSCAR